MKILLTGASGLLGSAFAKSARRRRHEVIGIVGSYEGTIEGLSEVVRLDLADRSSLESCILERFPDAIVNCAAVSSPTDCEQDPVGSRRINVELLDQLALLARHLFATLIHVSTEQVHDGSKDRYTSQDRPSPANEYARQKVESEDRVRELAEEFSTVLRLPLLTGNSLSGERSVHEQLLRCWELGETTALFTDEIRQPCSADNAADVMVELCERSDLKGVYHWAGAATLSRFALGQAIVAHFGLSSSLISAARRDDDPRFASRPARLIFDLTPLSGKLRTRPESLEQQLDRLIVPRPRRAWYNSV